jgi:hypothetical protein
VSLFSRLLACSVDWASPLTVGSDRIRLPQHVLPLGSISSSCPTKTERGRSLPPATARRESAPTDVIPEYDADDAWLLDESVQRAMTELEANEVYSLKVGKGRDSDSAPIDVQVELDLASLRIRD